MNSSLLLLVFSCFIAASYAYKCFVCTSLSLDNNANDAQKQKPAYKVRHCQLPSTDSNCTSSDFEKTFSIGQYYKGDACSNFDAKKLNNTDNIVDCKQGCVKITSVVLDRGQDLTRVTRQCAFYDEAIVGKYINTASFKRTGAGSDKVSNWFSYCSQDYCNSANGVSSSAAVLIASFYGVLAFLYH